MDKSGLKVARAFLIAFAALLALSLLDHGAIDEHKQDEKYMEIAGILVPRDVNASNHLYPYLAAMLTCGCILIILMTIILFGGSLGSEE